MKTTHYYFYFTDFSGSRVIEVLLYEEQSRLPSHLYLLVPIENCLAPRHENSHFWTKCIKCLNENSQLYSQSWKCQRIIIEYIRWSLFLNWKDQRCQIYANENLVLLILMLSVMELIYFVNLDGKTRKLRIILYNNKQFMLVISCILAVIPGRPLNYVLTLNSVINMW